MGLVLPRQLQLLQRLMKGLFSPYLQLPCKVLGLWPVLLHSLYAGKDGAMVPLGISAGAHLRAAARVVGAYAC